MLGGEWERGVAARRARFVEVADAMQALR